MTDELTPQRMEGATVIGTLNRYGPPVLTALAAVLVFARLWLVLHRLYDPDEFEHLHAGYCVWQGMVPYRDFFEQHGPVLWYVSLPLFSIWGPALGVLTAGRFVIWLFGVLTAGLTWQLGNQLYGRWGGALASILLALMPTFLEKHIEWRPDNVAVPLILLATLAMTDGRSQRSRWSIYLAGSALAAAFLCTQKILYVGVGLMVGSAISQVLDRMATGCQAQWLGAAQALLRSWFLMMGAGILVVCAFFGFFAVQGALGESLEMLLLIPLRWQTYEPVGPQVMRSIVFGPIFWGASLAGLILTLADSRLASFRSAGVLTVALGVLAHLLGLLHVPAAYQQYFLPISPLAAVLGARALIDLSTVRGCRQSSGFDRGVRWVAVLVGLAVVMFALVIRTKSPHDRFDWPLLLWGGLSTALVARIRGHGVVAGSIVLAVAVMASLPTFVIQYQMWSQIREGQARCMRQLMNATSEQDRFLDGFTGYGALRPHAFYYFWINRHSWPMIPESRKEEGLKAALADPRTRVVLYDQDLSLLLPPSIQGVLDREFAPDLGYSQVGKVVVFVRKGRELPSLLGATAELGAIGPPGNRTSPTGDPAP